MSAERLEDGVIPESMQWKKASVFAVSDAGRQEFIEWLGVIPLGLDTVKVQAWDNQATGTLELFVLFGWSTSGADELRRASVDSVTVRGREVNVYVSRPFIQSKSGLMGTADMKFVGWKIGLEKLASGNYTGKLHVRRDTITFALKSPYTEERISSGGYQEVAYLAFSVKSAK